MIKQFFIAVFLFASTAAHAHSPLTGSEPPDGATLQQAPASVQLQFRSRVRLVSAVLELASGSKQRLTVSKKVAKEHIVALEDVSTGKVTVRWKALSMDGHSMSGSVSFSVTP